MVLVKMLMEIDPLPMRGLLVMTMAMISPSRREVSRQNSSTGALDCFRQGSASWQRSFFPKACLLFFPRRKTSYSRRWESEGHQGAHEAGGRAQGGRARPPPLWLAGGPPLVLSSPNIFIYSKTDLHEDSGLLELCRIGL